MMVTMSSAGEECVEDSLDPSCLMENRTLLATKQRSSVANADLDEDLPMDSPIENLAEFIETSMKEDSASRENATGEDSESKPATFWTECYHDWRCQIMINLGDATDYKKYNHWRDNCINSECARSGYKWNPKKWKDCDVVFGINTLGRYQGECIPDAPKTSYWTPCYQDGLCKMRGVKEVLTRRRDNYRDNCIQNECERSGLTWDQSKWKLCDKVFSWSPLGRTQGQCVPKPAPTPAPA